MQFDAQGWYQSARIVPSPNHDPRPDADDLSLIVIHNISLPPNQYGGPGVEQLFTNTLDATAHPYYAEIAHLRVSAHFFIRRDGEVVQFVPITMRAWHAGVSCWQGREKCNDFSIGIELEGCDTEAFTQVQYSSLNTLLRALQAHKNTLTDIAGHSDIAPGRKTDPGPYFDWAQLHQDSARPLR